MINLSAFIQFVGALYLSIAIDSILFKRFWNPDFFAMMSSNIRHYTEDKVVNISSELSNKLTDTAKEISDKIDTRSRWQGCMMLIYSVALLVAFGFKNDFNGDQVNTVSFCLQTFIVLGILSFLLSSLLLRSWWSMFVTSAVVLVLPFAVFLPFIARYLNAFSIPIVWLKITMIVFLLLPIAWRVFYNWLFSSVYSKYIHAQIKCEYKTYVQTKTYLKNNQSDKIDKRYNGVLADFFNKKGNQDTDNVCAEQYVNLITEQCNKIPSIFELLKHRNDKIDEETNNIENEEIKESVQPINIQTIDNQQEFENFFIQFEQLKGSMKLQDFCKEKKIDLEIFRSYRKERLKK